MQKNITRIEHPRRSHMVGDGFRVTQYIPGYGNEMNEGTSPFLMLDYNAPWQIPPQSGHRPGVGFHPHRGFETVTIVYSGEIEHQDTAGNGGVIGFDEVQWMTAGSGLLHNEFMTERFSLTGGIQHVVQLWVNLPREYKMTPPKYQALTRESIPEVAFEGGFVRVISGELNARFPSSREQGNEMEGNVAIQDSGLLRHAHNDETIEQKGIANTFSPVELYDVRFEKQGILDILIPENYTTMLLVVEGKITVNEKEFENGDMVHFSRLGKEINFASTHNAKILIMAGDPIGEPISHYGPFVMNTHAEIEQAFLDLREGKMGNPNV